METIQKLTSQLQEMQEQMNSMYDSGEWEIVLRFQSDARIAPALNKIKFKKKVSLEEQKAQKEDRFLRRRQIALMIYDYFE